MPLDTSSYSLALLRLDGRRWNELRRLHGQLGAQSAADGSSFLEMGNTKVICTVTGPEETRRATQGAQSDRARIEVEVGMAPFASTDRRRRARADKRTQELEHTVERALASTLLTQLYPHSGIRVALRVLAADGSLLAALLNAATLALVDAGVPMRGYVAACTAGSTASYAANDEDADPLLDLNGQEETELPSLTVATLGGQEAVVALVLETRVQMARVEGMLAVGVDGCRQIRDMMDGIVRDHGKRMLGGAGA